MPLEDRLDSLIRRIRHEVSSADEVLHWEPVPYVGYKAVAKQGSKWLSVFDGVTEYSLNELTVAGHNQLYVYPTHDEARAASFPMQSRLNGAKMVVLKVLCYGPGRCSGRKWAFRAVLPIAVVDVASPPFR
mmetsp:Transcript_71556/g.190842  ORF Transcript_71556/g.190842 Transcript_71556/m.190842 type:complete len:131 (+) Transcript_71556:1788-2180(+)